MSELPLSPRARRIKYVALAALILLVAGGSAWWILTAPTPPQLLAQGLTAGRHNPERAEPILRRALTVAGGHYPDAEIALCRILIRRGEWDEAAKLLAQVDQSACRPDLLLAFAREALLADHRTEALATLETLAERGVHESTEAVEVLIGEYQEWGEDDKLVAAATELTRLQPENPARWAFLIHLLADMSRDLECVAAIHNAERHNLPQPMRLEALNVLVSREINLGDAGAARRALTELRKGEGETHRVRGQEASVYRLEGHLDQALEVATSLLRDVPNLPYAYFTRGIIYLDLRRFDEASRDLERTIAAEPFNAAAQFKLSEAYRGQGKVDLAQQHRTIAADISQNQKRIGELKKLRQVRPRDPKLYTELRKDTETWVMPKQQRSGNSGRYDFNRRNRSQGIGKRF